MTQLIAAFCETATISYHLTSGSTCFSVWTSALKNPHARIVKSPPPQVNIIDTKNTTPLPFDPKYEKSRRTSAMTSIPRKGQPPFPTPICWDQDDWVLKRGPDKAQRWHYMSPLSCVFIFTAKLSLIQQTYEKLEHRVIHFSTLDN
jgi:hypothetical protein